VLFEDAGWRTLRPLTDVLPVPALAFGGSTLGERLRRATGAESSALAGRAAPLAAWSARPGATPVAAAAPAPGDGLAVLAAALPGPWLDAVLREPAGTRAAWLAGDRLVAARLPAADLAPLAGSGERMGERLLALGLPRRSADARVAAYPWQLIEWNAEAIAADLAVAGGRHAGGVHPQAVLLEPARIAIAPGARIDPFAVLDARSGPIAVGEAAVIESHSRIVGPCAIGAATQILGGVVGNGSTIGPGCRIAGEVEASIWQGFANKRHHGFVGHSVIGEWVNLGALTTTSDLKNNYGPVRVTIDGREIDSGNPKVGAIVGAHVKTGIGTLLPTGAVVGTGANLFGGGRFAPKSIASFAWWDGEAAREHELEKFLATARIAMSRRGRALEAAEERLLRDVFAATAGERARPTRVS
jgi:UDP-N-acetylglucosamine diphosphorylase/glucosamine-1-phosphate N-acetyltransferase